MEKFQTWFLVISILIEAFFDDKERLQDLDRMVMPSDNSVCYLPVTACLLGVTNKYHIQLPKENIFCCLRAGAVCVAVSWGFFLAGKIKIKHGLLIATWSLSGTKLQKTRLIIYIARGVME